MTVQQASFYSLAAFTVAAALVVVLGRNIVRCAVSLIFAFCGVAGIYVLLDAEFLAAVQVIIYVGGITILVLFAIMLTSRIAARGVRILNEQVVPSAVLTLAILALAIFAAWKGVVVVAAPPPIANTTSRIGDLLLTQYALPFEAVSILLLAGMVGAIILARKEKE